MFLAETFDKRDAASSMQAFNKLLKIRQYEHETLLMFFARFDKVYDEYIRCGGVNNIMQYGSYIVSSTLHKYEQGFNILRQHNPQEWSKTLIQQIYFEEERAIALLDLKTTKRNKIHQNTNSNRQTEPNNSPNCTFCKKGTHKTEDCFQKKVAEKQKNQNSTKGKEQAQQASETYYDAITDADNEFVLSVGNNVENHTN